MIHLRKLLAIWNGAHKKKNQDSQDMLTGLPQEMLVNICEHFNLSTLKLAMQTSKKMRKAAADASKEVSRNVKKLRIEIQELGFDGPMHAPNQNLLQEVAGMTEDPADSPPDEEGDQNDRKTFVLKQKEHIVPSRPHKIPEITKEFENVEEIEVWGWGEFPDIVDIVELLHCMFTLHPKLYHVRISGVCWPTHYTTNAENWMYVLHPNICARLQHGKGVCALLDRKMPRLTLGAVLMLRMPEAARPSLDNYGYELPWHYHFD